MCTAGGALDVRGVADRARGAPGFSFSFPEIRCVQDKWLLTRVKVYAECEPRSGAAGVSLRRCYGDDARSLPTSLLYASIFCGSFEVVPYIFWFTFCEMKCCWDNGRVVSGR